MESSVLVLLALLFIIPIVIGSYRMLFGRDRREPMAINHSELEAAERSLKAEANADWVVLKRCHGPAYNHAAMAALISALSAEGVRATYDVLSASSADGGVTNFMLKVVRGQERQAIEILNGLEADTEAGRE